jgi:hypothetical protein
MSDSLVAAPHGSPFTVHTASRARRRALRAYICVFRHPSSSKARKLVGQISTLRPNVAARIGSSSGRFD